ncbi:hypothetical protein AB9F39_37225, partial [Rhizobium leguminosarum]
IVSTRTLLLPRSRTIGNINLQRGATEAVIAAPGANGSDVTLKVPVGTQIFEEDQEKLICDLTVEGQRYCLAHGGNGGFGTAPF